MTDTNQVSDKTLGEQMADLLLRKPKNFDVTFCVGPGKIKVPAVKLILKAASPVFEKVFEDKWESFLMAEGEGIPLPNIDPTAFQLFVNLLILDSWSLDSIKSLKLSPNNLLNLLSLCRRYKITKSIKNLEEAADDFIQSFATYKDTAEFLEISRENLETIFSFENISLDEKEIFEYACRWASNQCTNKGLEPTGENYRKVLGGYLFQIRFPTMSNEEFTEVGRLKKNVLKGDEKLAVYEYIGLSSDEKINYDTNQLHFRTKHRAAEAEVGSSSTSSFGCSVFPLPPQYKLTTCPSFVCNGSQCCRRLQVDQKISLLGIGLLGPVVEDTSFEVTFRMKRKIKNSYENDSGTLRKTIFARKGKIFRFLFDEPITVESNTYDISWGNSYEIFFSLKGSNNVSQYKVDNPKGESVQASGVEFRLSSSWNSGTPLAELLFKKI